MKGNAKDTAPGAFSKFGKWFYAFVAAAVLLVGAIVAIIVISVNANKVPDEVPFYEGKETGVYYFDAALGEYTLTLNSGNKFTLVGPDLNKSGEYTISDNTVALDFVKDEDGTAEATFDGDTLTLVYQDATLNFLKKVTYTVSFNTNGGDAVDEVSVINGKTVGKPADPNKNGSVFLGWYADADLTRAFHFGATPVFDNITVYAKWAETVPGQDEYVVDFDLGYEAEAPAPVTTVGGKLVFRADYTDPARDGYTFAGWFISDYEDGSKLTYAAAEGITITANTTLFAVWNENSTTKLQAPSVSAIGNTISWDAVDGASAYQVTVTDDEGNVLFNQSVGTTTQSYNFTSAEPGDYVIKVVAKGTSKNDSDTVVRCYRNKALGRVSRFTVIGSTLVFNSVENAEKYLITINCGNKEHNHILFDNGKSTYYNFENCSMQSDGISFTVTAIANGYASTTSETFCYVRNLDKVSEIVYDADTAAFRWASVPDAAKYFVTISCDGQTVATVDNGSATSYCVKNYAGNVAIEVVPVSFGYNSPEAAKAKINKTTPATPANITVSDMTVTWDAAKGAKSYVIRVNGTSYNVSGTSFKLSDIGLSFVAGNQYTISVQAVGDTENSIVSDTVTATYLSMGTVSYYNNTVSWTPVIGTARFEVRVNGGESIFVSDGNQTKVVLTRPGVNTVEVRPANFASDAEWTVVEVKAYQVTYESRSINGSVTEYVAKGDTLSLPCDFVYAGFDFNGWYNTPGAAEGNGAEYTGTVFEGNGDTVLYANWTPKSYQIEFIGIDDSMSGVATGDKATVTYTKGYTLPVMTTTDVVKSNFAGWYTGPGGTGTKLTDYLGNSVAPYGVTTDSIAYPYFTSGLVFELKNDNTYAVKKGADIDTIPEITIPVTYNGIAVTSILENGFYNCDSLVKINIPDTIRLIGTGAFSSCDALTALNVYEVTTDTPHEVFYHSYDGALLYDDVASGYTYLEVFPRAKKGAFTVPDSVDVVRSRAFNYAKISTLTISKDVLIIGDYAFSNCRSLKKIIFEEGGTVPVSVSTNAFYGCYAVTYLKLPALIKASGEEEPFDVSTLNYLTALETVEVEKVTGAYFSSVDGMLCNELGDTILYCPLGYTGISGTLTIPKGITSIGNNTFRERNAFTKVVVPNYVTSIGDNAFYGCRNITEIVIEGSRSRDLEIGDRAFYGCSNTREILFEGNGSAVPDTGRTTIGSSAFSGQLELRTLTVGSGANIAEVGTSAFASDLKLRNINVDAGAVVNSIGNSAFKGCEGLTSFTIPATTTSIGDSAFADCSYISKIIFAPNGQNIDFGSYVFQNCVSLTSVELPATVQSFDGSAFDGCDSLRTITVDPANTYLTTVNGVLYDKNITEIMFYPKGIDDSTLANLPWNTLTKIGNTVFKDNPNITSVTIPANVTVIGDGAFNGCVNLTSVTVATDGTSLTVGDYAFANCQKLASISLPSYTAELGEGVFYLTPLTSFTVPENVETIGRKAFMYTGITSIHIPAKVSVIGDGAFAYSSLESITFEEGSAALVLGEEADISISYDFESDDYDTKKNAKLFPNQYIGVDAIGVFTGTSLKEVRLPERMTQIGAFAFFNITSLNKVDIAENSDLTVIGDAAFYGSGIKSINLENTKLSKVGDFAFTESRLTGVKFPNTVTMLEKYAFADIGTISGTSFTPTLTSVEFMPGGTEALTIMNSAFKNSAFSEITLPSNLSVCTEKILVGSNNPTYALNIKSLYKVFEGNVKLAAINVEDGCEKYASLDGIFYEKNASGDLVELIFCPPAKTGEVTIPKTVVHVESRAFYLSQLTKITFENYETSEANYGKALLEIGSGEKTSSSLVNYTVFGGRTNNGTQVTSTLLNGYNSLVKSRIYNKQKLVSSTIQEINFPAHLKLVSSYAVSQISTAGFTVNFDMNSEPVEFSAKAMFQNPGLEVLALPKVKSLAQDSWYSSTFGSNTALKSVTFAEGSTLTLLPDSAFSGCTSLTSIEIPASVTIIDDRCFSNCKALTKVTFAEGSKLAQIGTEAFANTGLTEFIFPDTVITLEEKIFNGCTALEKVTIGTGITSVAASDANGVASSVFRGCTSIKEYAVAKNHPTLSAEDGVLYDVAKSIVFAYPPAKDPTGYAIPSTVKEIGMFAFAQFKGTTIELPGNLTRIGYGAFLRSALESVHIPASVTTIDGYAFSGESSSTNLMQVTFAENSQLTTIGNYAFSKSQIVEIVLPDNVERLGRGALSSCENLKTVILSSALKELDDSAFYLDSKLETVVFQNNLTSIGTQCFMRCSSIKSLELPASLSYVSLQAFANCTSLESLTFAEGIHMTSIGYQAFMECSALKSITLPEGLGEIGHTLFMKCSSLETVDLSKTQVTSLSSNDTSGNGMFYGCAALKTVLLPETIETIGKNCFSGCSALEAIEIPASVTSIGPAAFDGCSSLASVKFSGNSLLTELGSNTFRGTASLNAISLPDAISSIGTSIFENSGLTSITLPGSLNVISASAFKGCENLTSVSIPATVTDIYGSAFENCVNLETVTMEEGVEFIGSDAFGNCAKITEIVVPSTVLRMGGNPFSNCTGLTNFRLADGNESFLIDSAGVLYDANMRTIIFYPSYVTTENYEMPGTVFELSSSAFAGSQLKSIVISDNIKVIPDGCFKNSVLLESVTIPLSVIEIGNEAFRNCEKLNHVAIPGSCTSIGNYAFENCTSLTDFDFGTRNTSLSVGISLFRGCTSLEQVVLPEGLTAIPAYMFAGTGITNLVIPASVTDLSGTGLFMECTKLESVEFPENYEGDLGAKAFYGCTSLKSVVLPDGLGKMGGNDWREGGSTFKNCTSLESVTFGSALNTFGASAFENCTSLKVVDLSETSLYAIENDVFKNCTSLTTLVVGPDCYDLGSSSFEGCTSLTGVIELPYCWLYGGFFKDCTSIDELHFTAWDWFENYGSDGEYAGNFEGWTSEQKVIFDETSYEDLIDNGFFDADPEMALMLGSAARVFDCDGNEIIYDTESGEVMSVIDEDGNIIFEP